MNGKREDYAMNVGLIGLGVMGMPLAERLLNAKHTLTVHNRTAEKAQPLLKRGANWADTPADVARNSEVVISIVSDPAAVEAISLSESGILVGLGPDSVHCDLSTVGPAWSKTIAQVYAERERRFVQSPVLGSKRQIEEGLLLVFGGGAEEDVRRCEPVWRAFAARVWHLPTPEQAATTKLACNLLIAHMILGLGQSLLFAQKGGVTPAKILDILDASALGAPMYKSKGNSILERNFNANFYVQHMLKDLSLAADAGRETGTSMPLNALSRELFIAAAQQGWGEEDYSAVVKVLEQMAGVELHS
jgi:3-hydroxyisobutyrate dehydrogenase-like beta-hydroxyacid dehydrogenase